MGIPDSFGIEGSIDFIGPGQDEGTAIGLMECFIDRIIPTCKR